MKNDGKFILDGKRVKFSDYGGSSMTTKYLTTEPPLDPQEHIDGELWKQWRNKERKREEMEYENNQYEQFLYECRMNDSLEDSLLEMEGK